MFHWQILLGLMGGVIFSWQGGAAAGGVPGFLARIVFTCAVFFIFFSWRLLGAGDIKVMALCVGYLGISPGATVIFLGLLLASIPALWRLWREEALVWRLRRLFGFFIGVCLGQKLSLYPGWEEEGGRLRLAPYLFGGFCLYLVMQGGRG